MHRETQGPEGLAKGAYGKRRCRAAAPTAPCGLGDDRSAEGAARAYPSFCLTQRTPDEEFEDAAALYRDDPETARIFQAAAEVEGLFYSQLTRVEEVMVFARRIGARKIGIATCMGLIDEAQAFARILRAKGFEDVCAVACKVGAVAKERAGIADDVKVHPGCFEPTCNPIMQARILNEAGLRPERDRGPVRGPRHAVHEACGSSRDLPGGEGPACSPTTPQPRFTRRARTTSASCCPTFPSRARVQGRKAVLRCWGTPPRSSSRRAGSRRPRGGACAAALAARGVTRQTLFVRESFRAVPAASVWC